MFQLSFNYHLIEVDVENEKKDFDESANNKRKISSQVIFNSSQDKKVKISIYFFLSSKKDDVLRRSNRYKVPPLQNQQNQERNTSEEPEDKFNPVRRNSLKNINVSNIADILKSLLVTV